jgi:hypothetical protein
VRVEAADISGNTGFDTSNGLFDIITPVPPAPVTSYPITLVAGWNLVSFPLIPGTTTTATLMAPLGARVQIVWGYEGVAWKSWAPLPMGGLLTTMRDGLGYWINITAGTPVTLTISGTEILAPPATPPSYSVVTAWNLIGFKSVTSLPHAQYLNSVAGNYSQILTYDRVTGVYPNIYPVGNGILSPGIGYWLHMRVAGTIVPPGR